MLLVADIGGTNARVARVKDGETAPSDTCSFVNAEYTCLEDVICDYLNAFPTAAIEKIVVAVAGPVQANVGRLTNLNWVVDGGHLSERFGGAKVVVINDLTALGYSALQLSAAQLQPIGEQKHHHITDGQALVVGIGTGFNVSPVIANNGTTICPPVEAGHMSLPLRVARALDALTPGLAANFDTVEDLFSGKGRRKFLSLRTGTDVPRATPHIQRKGAPDNAGFDAALDEYAALIGHLLQDLKTTYLPLAGIYLAGGVARSSLIDERAARCLDTYDAAGQFVQSKIPLWIINEDAAALVGCRALAA
ncbi:glucokinase [Loktanella sp. S4079]|uniref:glucokinase n=1 Tax=Loktanella sp. S4079 TaxID=579483 RepID=UPI0005FA9448|nr:glucokinase [Loktanella sp. S4079]KJZ18587.1 hypothetical protein TW80_14335 [Loktanella sp. S4079]